MGVADALGRGRDAYARQAWADAYRELAVADSKTPLVPEDLERLANASFLTGDDERCAEVLARLHQELEAAGDRVRAARNAFWLAYLLAHRGQIAQAGGWANRAQRLLAADGRDCVERGYLLLLPSHQLIMSGDLTGASSLLADAIGIGERFDEPDLLAQARTMQGRALILLGEPETGLAMLDEAMVAVTAGEVTPIVAGDVYCTVIEGCQDVFDLRRAEEWTAALTRWCDAQPDLVPYSGQCLVHRTQIMRMHGRWPDALAEARRAKARYARSPGQPAVGAAIYEEAELHRLRGEFVAAETAYREATRFGHPAQPGMALLRLAQGDAAAAETSLRRASEEMLEPRLRHSVLAAYVEAALAADEVPRARVATEQLAQAAADVAAPLLQAMAAQALGAVQLAEGDAVAAVRTLRQAWNVWHDLDAPYDAARVRVLIGKACGALGDADGHSLELDAARWVFRELGAIPELAGLDRIAGEADPGLAAGLTRREVEVLRLVAAGKTNRAIAGDLFLSEKTVARHVSNIFTKLGLSSRSGATAFAYEHGLV